PRHPARVAAQAHRADRRPAPGAGRGDHGLGPARAGAPGAVVRRRGLRRHHHRGRPGPAARRGTVPRAAQSGAAQLAVGRRPGARPGWGARAGPGARPRPVRQRAHRRGRRGAGRRSGLPHPGAPRHPLPLPHRGDGGAAARGPARSRPPPERTPGTRGLQGPDLLLPGGHRVADRRLSAPAGTRGVSRIPRLEPAMAIHEHLTEFAGLPVVDYTPGCFDDRDARIRAAFADPGTAAWRLRAWYAEQKTFAAYFSDFTDQVDAARVTALIMGEWLGRGGLED